MEFIHEKIDLGYETLDRAEHSDGRRYLTLDGVAYPSVTTVLSILGEEKIAAWKAKVGEEKAEQIGRVARERGTAVHSIVEKYLKNEDTEDFLPHIKQSLENLKPLFHKGFGNIYGNEVPLYSDHLKLAGTCDCIAEWHGVPSVIDFKTSRRPKKKADIPNYFCQLAAYSVMWEERTGMPVTNLIVIMDVDNFHPVTYKEHRDNWIPMLKDTIKEYEHRKMYRP